MGKEIFLRCPKNGPKTFFRAFSEHFSGAFSEQPKKFSECFSEHFSETAHQKLQVPKKLQRILSGSMEGHRATWLVIGLDRILDAIVRHNTMPKGTRD